MRCPYDYVLMASQQELLRPLLEGEILSISLVNIPGVSTTHIEQMWCYFRVNDKQSLAINPYVSHLKERLVATAEEEISYRPVYNEYFKPLFQSLCQLENGRVLFLGPPLGDNAVMFIKHGDKFKICHLEMPPGAAA